MVRIVRFGASFPSLLVGRCCMTYSAMVSGQGYKQVKRMQRVRYKSTVRGFFVGKTRKNAKSPLTGRGNVTIMKKRITVCRLPVAGWAATGLQAGFLSEKSRHATLQANHNSRPGQRVTGIAYNRLPCLERQGRRVHLGRDAAQSDGDRRPDELPPPPRGAGAGDGTHRNDRALGGGSAAALRGQYHEPRSEPGQRPLRGTGDPGDASYGHHAPGGGAVACGRHPGPGWRGLSPELIGTGADELPAAGGDGRSAENRGGPRGRGPVCRRCRSRAPLGRRRMSTDRVFYQRLGQSGG